MAKQTIDVLIEGGKATAAPPLGPALGPLKVNIGQVVSTINDKTKDFKGMQVPVKVTVDEDTKEFEITIGTPPASGLIKKELGIKSAAGNPLTDVVGDLSLDQLKKIANMKADALLGKNLKMKAHEIAGTCNAMGVTIDGLKGIKFIEASKAGKYDAQLKD